MKIAISYFNSFRLWQQSELPACDPPILPVTFSHTLNTICSHEMPIKWCWHWAAEACTPICSLCIQHLAFLGCITLLKPPASGMPGARRLSRWKSYSESCAHFTCSKAWKVYRGLVLTGRNRFGKHRVIHTLRGKSHRHLHNAPSLRNQGGWLPGWHVEDKWVKLRPLPDIFHQYQHHLRDFSSLSFSHLGKIVTMEFEGIVSLR